MSPSKIGGEGVPVVARQEVGLTGVHGDVVA